MKAFIYIFIGGLFLLSEVALAQKIELNDDPSSTESEMVISKPQTGKKAAQKYFKKESESSFSSNDHFLMIGVGSYFSSESYRWGKGTPKPKNPGKFNIGVSYRFGEWINSSDLLFRFEYQTFDVNEDRHPKKFSILPVIIFPDASSRFPVYFGAGAGMGVFFKQAEKESSVSFDYQLFLGARLFDTVGNIGFFTEAGMKNHILLLTSGQLNGFYFTLGTLHTF